MTRSTLALTAALALAACSGGSERPGALLRGPGALAVFDGVVAHESLTLRAYLAVANERGDELRLIDTTDNDVVESPGLAFPLSVPFDGRPLWLASADLADAGELPVGEKPDALAVITPGADAVEIVDTWSGYPTVAFRVALPAGAEVTTLGTAPVPDGGGQPIPGRARFLVGLGGGQLAVIDVARDTLDGRALLAPGAPEILTLGFDVGSLAAADAPGLVYAASPGDLPGGVRGVAGIVLPADLTGWTAGANVSALDARVPTALVAAATFAAWDFPAPGVPSTGAFGAAVERVVAIPVPGTCGDGRPIQCGLLALDPAAAWDPARGHLVPNPVPSEEPWLLPIDLPAPVLGLAATGRSDPAALLPYQTAAGTTNTTGLAVATAADGRIYFVDLARWALASDTDALEGSGRTRVAAATPAAAAAPGEGTLGLWALDGSTVSSTELTDRVRVTPGFTTTETWTLAWKGVLPALEDRAVVLGRDGGGLWLAVQIGDVAPVAAANLAALGVQAGDAVEVGGIPSTCPLGATLTVTALVAPDAARPGGAVRLAAAGTCLEVEPVTGTLAGAGTFRAGGLLLSGDVSGHAGRPSVDVAPPLEAPPELLVAGERRFYVTDACADGECPTNWGGAGLVFPLPDGPALGLRAGFVDADGLPSAVEPAPGTAITFTTASGLTPSGRRPVKDGSALATVLPNGLALTDGGEAGKSAKVFASYAAGMVVVLSTGSSPATMTVVR